MPVAPRRSTAALMPSVRSVSQFLTKDGALHGATHAGDVEAQVAGDGGLPRGAAIHAQRAVRAEVGGGAGGLDARIGRRREALLQRRGAHFHGTRARAGRARPVTARGEPPARRPPRKRMRPRDVCMCVSGNRVRSSCCEPIVRDKYMELQYSQQKLTRRRARPYHPQGRDGSGLKGLCGAADNFPGPLLDNRTHS
jgi:hypothetical protein